MLYFGRHRKRCFPRSLYLFISALSSAVISSLMMCAGTPATMQLSGTSFTTTALAPIMTLFPIRTGPRILAPAQISTLSPMMGTSYHPLFPPMVTFCPMRQ